MEKWLYSQILFIKGLQNRELVNNQETIILKECAGTDDLLKRQIALEKKYSELRKFALTLHFYSPKAYEFIRKTHNTCL